MEIQIQALKKNYRQKAALDNISLTIGNGMFGLLPILILPVKSLKYPAASYGAS